MNMEIDVVYTWVDGGDARLNSIRSRYTDGGSSAMDEKSGGTRFSNLGELGWSVASVNRFMPWVRRIYIVTDGQDPSRELELTKLNFPNPIPVEIVDHRTIYRGMEDLLPVFNSLSIETLLWRIPGLSDRFIYFNDDLFVLAPMSPQDWFAEDSLIVHGSRVWLTWAKMIDSLRRKDGQWIMGAKTPMIRAAEAVGAKEIITYHHGPVAQDRRLFEEFYALNPELLRRNASARFREPWQYLPQTLCLLLAQKKERLKLESEKTNLFLKPLAEKKDYLTKRLAAADRNSALRTGCINSLDKASAEQQKEFEEWIRRRLNIRD